MPDLTTKSQSSCIETDQPHTPLKVVKTHPFLQSPPTQEQSPI